MALVSCGRGRRYPTELDAKIGLAEAIRAGRHSEGYYLCNKCGGYHIGLPKKKPIVEKCWATVKRCYHTEDEAREMLGKLRAKGREENGYYECHYCDRYHLTSHYDNRVAR